jgi:dephospho-CoA kinase
MKLFGLTGNIGCGKSTTASLLSTYPDITVLDCDTIAKDIIVGGKYKEEINSILGEDVFLASSPDTGRIAEIIFTDMAKKERIESLIHPLVLQAIRDKAKAIPDKNICIVESAIIYEIRWEKEFSAIIVVSCDRRAQFRRLRERGMHINDITVRLANQTPSSEKEARADIVLRTDCPLEELGRKVHELYQELKAR